MRPPQPREVWTHTSGRDYTVLLIANQHSENPKYPPTVVYEGDNGRVWSRPLSDWHRSMTYKAECLHNWVDARNKYIDSGEVCLTCFKMRAGNPTTEGFKINWIDPELSLVHAKPITVMPQDVKKTLNDWIEKEYPVLSNMRRFVGRYEEGQGYPVVLDGCMMGRVAVAYFDRDPSDYLYD